MTDKEIKIKIKGVQGDQGLQGIQGVPGVDSTVPGPKGDTGEQGIPGIDGKTPIAGVDFPIPKNGRDGRDAIYVGITPPPNPQMGDLWNKI